MTRSSSLARDLQDVLMDIDQQERLIHLVRETPPLAGMEAERDRYLASLVEGHDRMQATLQDLLDLRVGSAERLSQVPCEADEL